MAENDPVGAVTLIAGAPGAGKSTVTEELVKLWDGPLWRIPGDNFWCFMARPRKDPPHAEVFKTIMRSMIGAALPFARIGYDVLIDFPSPPWFLPTALKMLSFRDVPLNYVVLSADKALCMRRVAERREGPVPDYSALERLFDSFQGHTPHHVPNTGRSAAETAAMIFSGLGSGLYRVSEETLPLSG